jgi:hypothetical protein
VTGAVARARVKTATKRRERRGAALVANATSERADPVATEVAALQAQDLEALRVLWRRRWQRAAPPMRSADVLMRLIAFRIQVEAYGDIDREIRQRLAGLERKVSRGEAPVPDRAKALPPGIVMTRDWRGKVYTVTVVEDGFLHEGIVFSTLSEVARAITGTRWSGPRFFGVAKRLEAARGSSPKPAKHRAAKGRAVRDGRAEVMS